MRRICLPLALASDDIDKLDKIIDRGRTIKKGEYLFRQDQPFESLFALRSGSVKTSLLSRNGEEQVSGFYFPGELLGLDGIGGKKHASSAITLEDAAVCEIPFGRLVELSQCLPSLQQHTMDLLSNEIVDDHKLFALLGKGSADSKLASFLLSLSSRQRRRQLSPTDLRLPMNRSDIGSYLGLTVESISRVLHKLQLQGMLAVNNRDIKIVDLQALQHVNADQVD